MALLPGSPAIDAGSNAVAQAAGLTTDQRGPGFSRIVGAAVDLGAFETGNSIVVVNPFAGLTPQERFVQALYLDALGRAGSKTELDSWAVQFNQGLSQTDAQASIARGIDESWEGRDHLVKGWYETYLGRAAGGREEDGWVGLLFQGQSEEQVLSQILASPQFHNRYADAGRLRDGGPGLRPGAVPGAAGPNREQRRDWSWVATLPQQGRPGVALGFLTSVEYRTDLVESYYNVLLHRPPDCAGPGILGRQRRGRAGPAHWLRGVPRVLHQRVGRRAAPRRGRPQHLLRRADFRRMGGRPAEYLARPPFAPGILRPSGATMPEQKHLAPCPEELP